ncbi:IS3 family transposase [Actinomadura livida]|uniref:Integrase catalytic domain-containing protein n=1 Tax=Actinomadura livida TaxID=79909 RepID=A0ABN1EF57_9ACTN|nr:hypothetical protein GCM10010208_33610 [Actinomadura livida]
MLSAHGTKIAPFTYYAAESRPAAPRAVRDEWLKTELIKPCGPWKNLTGVELAIGEYVDWYNTTRRIRGPLLPPEPHRTAGHSHNLEPLPNPGALQWRACHAGVAPKVVTPGIQDPSPGDGLHTELSSPAQVRSDPRQLSAPGPGRGRSRRLANTEGDPSQAEPVTTGSLGQDPCPGSAPQNRHARSESSTGRLTCTDATTNM